MKYKSKVFDVSLVGIMFSLVLLFQFLEKFMPFFGTFVNMNITIVFIVPVVFISGLNWGIIMLILRFAIGPAIGTGGYVDWSLWGHFILFVSGMTFVLLLWFSYKAKLLKSKYGMQLSIIAVVIITSFTLTMLNGLLFTPVYFSLFSGGGFTMDYESVTSNFFNIKYYWAGVFAVYMTFNLLNLGLSAFLLMPILTYIKPMITNKKANWSDTLEAQSNHKNGEV